MGYNYDLDMAKIIWKKAKDELSFKEVTLEVVL